MSVLRSTILGVQRVTPIVLLCTTFHWQAIMAFQPIQRLLKRSVFSVDYTLPPLAFIHQGRPPRSRVFSNSTMSSMDTLTMPYSSRSFSSSPNEHHKNLEVLYTNDPKEINRWLTDHLSMSGCTVGFDTEVRTCFFFCQSLCGCMVEAMDRHGKYMFVGWGNDDKD